MCSTSVIRGTLCSTVAPSASVVAAISFKTEFLAPEMGTLPLSGPRGRTIRRSTLQVLPAPGAGIRTRTRWRGGGVARVEHRYEIDDEGLRRVRSPRDDVLLERLVEEGDDG